MPLLLGATAHTPHYCSEHVLVSGAAGFLYIMSLVPKFTEYLHRAEKICPVLDEGDSGAPNGADVAVASRPKSRGWSRRRQG